MSHIQPRPLRGDSSYSEQRRRASLNIPNPTGTAAGGVSGERKNRSATVQRQMNRPRGRGNR